MPLRLITGPANSAKAGAVLDAYRAALRRDPLLVVPTFADVEHYAQELAAGGAVFGGTVVRFEWLFEEVARATGYRAQRVGRLQRERLLAAAVADAPLDSLAESAASPGFVRALGDLVAELQRSLIEPGRFAAALRAWAGEDSARARYGAELGGLYGRYRRALERLGRVDAELHAWRALDALRAAPARWGRRPVFLYGFDDLTPVERDAVEALARVAGADVTVSLAYEPGRVAFASRASTFEELRPLADAGIEALPERADHYAPAARAALHHLERHLFEDPPGAVPPGDAVRLLEAGGERAEIELVAAEVLELLRAGVPAEEIAVVFRTPARAAALVEQVFGAFGIPFALDHELALRDTPLGRGTLALLRCALGASGADDVLAYLRTPGRLDRPALADALEARLRRAGTGDAAGALAAWDDLAGWPLDEVARLRAAAAEGPRALSAALAREGGRLLARPHVRRADLLADEELPDARALAALRAALNELDDLAAAAPWAAPTPGELADALADLPVRLGRPPRAGAVHVAGPLDVRARRYRALFLCGLQEDEFPLAGRPEPFLPDAVRREVNAASGLRLSFHEDRLGDERYLFYACASRPEERLRLSYRACDEEGNPAIPSFFLDDVRALLGPELDEARRARLLAEVTWVPAEAPTTPELARALAARGPREPTVPIAALRTDAALAPLRARVVSAGSLETWAACPVRWLVERHLDPAALEPDAEPLARGGLAHAVLEAALVRLREVTGSARVTPATLPEARRLAAVELQARCGAFPLSDHEPTARSGLRRLLREIERYLAFEAGAGGGWEPLHLEWRFGFEDEADGPPPLRLGDGEITVRGVIDRIDVDPSGTRAVVRDYKTGAVHPVAAWERDVRLQIALYLLAVRRLLGLEVVAGVYQPLRRGDLRGRGIVLEGAGEEALGPGGFVPTDVQSPEEFEQRLAWAEEHAVALAGELRAGALVPHPERCSSRGGCSYPGICRSTDS